MLFVQPRGEAEAPAVECWEALTSAGGAEASWPRPDTSSCRHSLAKAPPQGLRGLLALAFSSTTSPGGSGIVLIWSAGRQDPEAPWQPQFSPDRLEQHWRPRPPPCLQLPSALSRVLMPPLPAWAPDRNPLLQAQRGLSVALPPTATALQRPLSPQPTSLSSPPSIHEGLCSVKNKRRGPCSKELTI